MSLIQCPECGKEVSDKAQSCPNCGCPIQKPPAPPVPDYLPPKGAGIKDRIKYNKTIWTGIILTAIFTDFSLMLNPIFSIFLVLSVAILIYGLRSYKFKYSHSIIKWFHFMAYAFCGAIVAGIVFSISINTYDDPNTTYDAPDTSYTDSTPLSFWHENLMNQKRALLDLVDKNENGEDTNSTSGERLLGLADGINNTIISIGNYPDSKYRNDLLSLATTYRGIATKYGEYFKTGESELLIEAQELLEKAAELEDNANSSAPKETE